MYESPITQIIAETSSQIREAQDGRLIYEVQQAIGYDINKEELIKALRYDRDQYQKGYEDGRKDNEWISVSERLPEKYIKVLVTTDDGQVTTGEWCMSDDWLIYEDEVPVQTNELLAWQPLPEPYKAESEG